MKCMTTNSKLQNTHMGYSYIIFPVVLARVVLLKGDTVDETFILYFEG